jgi:hypothetical protein
MSFSFLAFLQADQVETTFKEPSYFLPLIVGSLSLGAVVWLVASVLGFARARAFGSATRWFSMGAVCMLLYHLQFLLLGFGLVLRDVQMSLTILSFFNLFAVLGGVCVVMGFVRLTSPR